MRKSRVEVPEDAEKNVIAIEKKKHVLATGDDAYDMLGKAPLDIQVSTPIQNGVIADISSMQILLNHFLEKRKRKSKKCRLSCGSTNRYYTGRKACFL